MNSVFTTFVDGPISKLLAEAKSVVSGQVRSFQRFGQRGRIELKPEYPEEAWFEALVNAVAHRSYNLKTQNIFVKIFDDRFVVESPGGFVPPTSAETVYDAHNPRNPYLMEAMMHLELTFCGYEGTRRMRRAMASAKLPEPRFRQIEAMSHQVHVTLENDIKDRRAYVAERVFQHLSEAQFLGLSPDERAIVNYLSPDREINVTHASLLTGKSWPTTNKIIGALVERGIIELSDKTSVKHDSKKAYRLRSRSN
jgi:ATP-dependent DNA helicase RecG